MIEGISGTTKDSQIRFSPVVLTRRSVPDAARKTLSQNFKTTACLEAVACGLDFRAPIRQSPRRRDIVRVGRVTSPEATSVCGQQQYQAGTRNEVNVACYRRRSRGERVGGDYGTLRTD